MYKYYNNLFIYYNIYTVYNIYNRFYLKCDGKKCVTHWNQL